jgi:mono/diheme cytochrome c family protein
LVVHVDPEAKGCGRRATRERRSPVAAARQTAGFAVARREALRHVRTMRAALAAAIVCLAAAPARAGSDGAALYDRFCVACHGAAGDGGGPAAPWLWPRPRDFTRAAYKWRSVPVGTPPTRGDLAGTIRWGAPGTAMPGFGAVLTPPQIDQLVDVVRGFAPDALGPGPTTGYVRFGNQIGDKRARGDLLWRKLGCATCHGDGGRGDGPAAKTLRDAADRPDPPYDLTAVPLRRPRPSDAPADVRVAIYDSVAYGLDGTPMPGYYAIGADDLWAVVDKVDRLRYRGPTPGNAAPLDPRAIAADRAEHLTRAGYWPGRGAPAEARVFGGAIAPQGVPPPSLTPAEASLSARRCARCHAKQAREWDGSLHGRAGSPGLIAQILRPGIDMKASSVESCQRCHAPLAEQSPTGPAFDADLRGQGVTCAACHVRAWRRHGPPRIAASLLPLPGYPLDTLALYERADFCLPCHQLPARLAVAGRPLLDTYREWLEGPYMRRGVQCQHCHMPNREHTWKGVHDPDTFRQGVRLETSAGRGAAGAVSVRARLWNAGAGHFLPTTPTPAVWLRIELLDGAGRPVRGARGAKRIGRAIAFRGGRFVQLEDTRIPPGESTELAAAWTGGRVAEARTARVTVEVAPDDYYEGFYRRALAGRLAPANRALYRAALARASSSHYVALTRDVAVAPPRTP